MDHIPFGLELKKAPFSVFLILFKNFDLIIHVNCCFFCAYKSCRLYNILLFVECISNIFKHILNVNVLSYNISSRLNTPLVHLKYYIFAMCLFVFAGFSLLEKNVFFEHTHEIHL